MSNSLFLNVLLLVSLTVQASGAAAGLARPSCAETCGNVTIPFPFGIGTGCFLDEWYEIVCQQDNHLPILNKIGLRVLDISLPCYRGFVSDMIRVSLPVIYSNSSCGGDGLGVQISLEGSQFVFSQTSNVFTLVGCNALAIVNSTESAVLGCRSICAGNHTDISRYSACSGKDGCCQSTLPINLQRFSVDFTEVGEHQGCKYAFLADRSQFLSSDFTGLYDLRLDDAVPVVLEWGIENNTKYALDLVQQDYTIYRLMDSVGFTCDRYSLYDRYSLNDPYRYARQIPVMQCFCGQGYSGNPYLIEGCKDLNECEASDICQGTCVNKLGGYDCVDGSKTTKIILAGVGAGIGGLVQLSLLSWWLYKVIRRRREIKRKEKYFKTQWGLLLQQHLSSSPGGNVAKSKLFSFKNLEKATDRFNEDRILGQGGQGVVYKGMLTDGKIVAVKKSKLMDKGKVEEFINEVIILSQLDHRNVVKLMGCCLETEIPLLVYEFIPNGTLFQYLHDPDEDLLMSWDTRLRIATEIGGALFYLHSAASAPIYHRDIKSTNILLDEKHRAKVADFGISKSVSIEQTHVTTLVRGTFGYLDPEYFITSHFTDKSDVYSFGVVLVELLTGQKPISWLGEEGRGLASYFIISMEQNSLFDIADARLMKEGLKEEITAVANLARRCLSSIGKNRQTMKEVSMELEAIKKFRSSSAPQQNQEKIEAAESHHATFTYGKSFEDIDVTSFLDVQPFAHCETW